MQRISNVKTGKDVRLRRDVASRRPAGFYNKEDVTFYIGLLFDGVPTYQNVSEALPQHGQLYMYKDPEVYVFEQEVLDFRHDDEHIVIKVAIPYSCYNASFT